MAETVKVEPAVDDELFGPLNNNHLINQMEPYSNRGCTDVCCLIFGLLFTLAVVALPYKYKHQKSIWQLNLPSDSDGKVCGFDHPQHQYLYFTNPPYISQRVCVAQCPTKSTSVLNCQPTQHLTCALGTTLAFAQTTPSQTPNGKICLPDDPTINSKLAQSRQLVNKFFFFKDYQSYYKRLGVALGLSMIVLTLLQCCPGPVMQLILFLSLICELGLGMVFYVYHTETSLQKIIVAFVLGVIFLFTVLQIVIYKQALKMTMIYMQESKKLVSHQYGLYLYIFFFVVVVAAFIFLVYLLYSFGLSLRPPTFDAGSGLYYQPDKTAFLVTVPVLAVYLFWGFYCIREVFNFFVSTHTLHEIYKPEGECSAFCMALKLLIGKHLGSIFAAAFINAFFFLPASVFDNIRSCGAGKFYIGGRLGRLFDLVRPDVTSYIVLTGSPYCTSAKYCEYLWFESMTTENIKSSMRIYKIASQVMVSTGASIISLFIFLTQQIIQAPVLYLLLLLGAAIASFFTGLHTDVCENIRLVYLIEEESFKRRDECFKYSSNSLNKADQLKFLREGYLMHSNKAVADEIVRMRRGFWRLEVDEDEVTKAGRKGKKKIELK